MHIIEINYLKRSRNEDKIMDRFLNNLDCVLDASNFMDDYGEMIE
jgi:hypothetical protein